MKKRVITEKGGLVALGVSLISIGAGQISETNPIGGTILVALGVVVIFVREYFKFHRWHDKTYWHNKEIRSE